MYPGASVRRTTSRDRAGIAWASVVAALFAVAATISFAVDQTVTLSNAPVLAPTLTSTAPPPGR
ncbi:MAG TPA: hypothetical protein VHY35_22905 [Stellaceae bacterium]|jgi:hypothetical protein|nr:hypothetical protein [Stellaceae bacterium]